MLTEDMRLLGQRRKILLLSAQQAAQASEYWIQSLSLPKLMEMPPVGPDAGLHGRWFMLCKSTPEPRKLNSSVMAVRMPALCLGGRFYLWSQDTNIYKSQMENCLLMQTMRAMKWTV